MKSQIIESEAWVAKKNQREKRRMKSPPCSYLKKRKVFALLIIFFLITLVPVSPALSLQDFHNPFKGKEINSKRQAYSTEVQQALKSQTHSVPLDDFFINLSQNRKQKIFKLKMNLKVSKPETRDEIKKRISQIREMIVILVSSKGPVQLSDPREKEILKEKSVKP